jgi:hypothetical protein
LRGARDTGFARADAQADFARQRRRLAFSRIAARLRQEPDDVSVILPFDEVVTALGRVSEHEVGLEHIPLESIVGTVDRDETRFDRAFLPTSPAAQERWQGIATAWRRGAAMPPIDVYRIGELHFVKDGHHRVSVARALGDNTIEAHVVEVRTRVGADSRLRIHDLPLKRHERVFHERIPLPAQARAAIGLSDEWRYAQLATLVEAWGLRASHDRGRLLSREEIAEAWFHEEYEPVVQVLRDAGIGGAGTETERYLRIATLRYLLLQTHDWTDEVVERLLGQFRPPSRHDDTMVHQILDELR